MTWKTHPVFIDYAISDDGLIKRITSKKGAKVGRILKPGITPYGYEVVNVSGRMKFVHVLVLETFLGPRPPGGEARHRNDMKRDNHIRNLSWGTHSDNYRDRVRNGGGNHGSRHGNAKLTEENVTIMRAAYLAGHATHKTLGKQFGVSREMVGRIVRRELWRHV